MERPDHRNYFKSRIPVFSLYLSFLTQKLGDHAFGVMLEQHKKTQLDKSKEYLLTRVKTDQFEDLKMSTTAVSLFF